MKNQGHELVRVLLLNPFEYAKVIRIVTHELTHALGFSSDQYANYVDDTGTPYANFLKTVYYNTNILTYKVTSPKVLAFVRDFFNCSTLDGMELENEDPGSSSGTPGSHWEKRLVGNEYMSPIGGPEIFLSKLTLSLYEDMGWYRANYSKADGSRYGYQAGCNFVEQACGTTSWGRYFCNVMATPNGPSQCNGDQTALGYCDLSVYQQPLPAGFQYFNNTNWGGSEYFSDYCPTYLGYSNTYCQDVVSGASFLGPDQTAQYASIFSANSVCFNFLLQSGSDAACYPISCLSNGSLLVTVWNTPVLCPIGGGLVNINIPYQGGSTAAQLQCPPVNFFCGQNTSIVEFGPTPASIISYSQSIRGVEFQIIVLLLSLLMYTLFVN